MVHQPKKGVGERLLRLYRQYVSRPVSGQLSLSTPGHENVSRPVEALASMDAPSTASGEAPPQVVHTVAEEVRKVQLVVIEDSSSSKAVSTVVAVKDSSSSRAVSTVGVDEDSSSSMAVSTVGQEEGSSSEAASVIRNFSDSLEQQVNDLSLLDAGGGNPGDSDGTGGDEQLLGSEEEDEM